MEAWSLSTCKQVVLQQSADLLQLTLKTGFQLKTDPLNSFKSLFAYTWISI